MIKSTFSIWLAMFFLQCTAQKKSRSDLVKFSDVISFYNVENLYDTISSIDYINGNYPVENPLFHRSISQESDLAKQTEVYKGIFDRSFFIKTKKEALRKQILSDEFTPKSSKKWNTDRYFKKLENLAKVIDDMAPVIIGLAEIENRQVLEDLVKTKQLKPYNYGIAHINSFDIRGIDCALLYNKERFKVEQTNVHQVPIYGENGAREYTRDILEVRGLLDGEQIYFLVNHWPSRRGGRASEPRRFAAAQVLRKVFNDILKKNPKAKILAMGDFNDDPNSPSIKKVLGTTPSKSKVSDSLLYNPMEIIFKKGLGTLAYKDRWNLFDQFIVSPGFMNNQGNAYRFLRAEIFFKPYLANRSGRYKGYPYRTYSGDSFTGGYSDHFPVRVFLTRKQKSENK